MSERIEHAAENSVVKLLARVFMIISLPVGGTFGLMALTKLERTSESTIRQEVMLQNIITYQIPAMTSNFDSRFNAQATRIDDAAKRIGKLEDWRLTMPATHATP
jgi:hypothetical protein